MSIVDHGLYIIAYSMTSVIHGNDKFYQKRYASENFYRKQNFNV